MTPLRHAESIGVIATSAERALSSATGKSLADIAELIDEVAGAANATSDRIPSAYSLGQILLACSGDAGAPEPQNGLPVKLGQITNPNATVQKRETAVAALGLVTLLIGAIIDRLFATGAQDALPTGTQLSASTGSTTPSFTLDLVGQQVRIFAVSAPAPGLAVIGNLAFSPAAPGRRCNSRAGHQRQWLEHRSILLAVAVGPADTTADPGQRRPDQFCCRSCPPRGSIRLQGPASTEESVRDLQIALNLTDRRSIAYRHGSRNR